jgi:hypothetical protein
MNYTDALMADYYPPDLSGLTLDEATEMLHRIHRIAVGMNCTRFYEPEDVCDLGTEITEIIERFEP